MKPLIPQLLPALLALALSACGHKHDASHTHDHNDAHAHDEAHDDPPKGPNGGRLHLQDGLSVELKIEEDGRAPRYVAWLQLDGVSVEPARAQVEVQLERLGGQIDLHRLQPERERLVGSDVVGEPHSFVVKLRARVDARSAEWRYDSFEGRTRIARGVADEAGVRVAPVSAGRIEQRLRAPGQVVVPADQRALVAARFPGLVRELRVEVGDRVAAGQTLATVESNASLGRYAVTSPIAGTVLQRHAALGALAGEAPLFEIAQLDTLAVELILAGTEAARVQAGAPVQLRRLLDGHRVEARVERVLPAVDTPSQNLRARVDFANDDGLWRPGMAVEAQVLSDEAEVTLRLPLSALQRFRDWQVAFVRVGDEYEIRPLELGRSDSTWIEVLEGLAAGDEVVVEQSFLIKADIEKSGASHDH